MRLAVLRVGLFVVLVSSAAASCATSSSPVPPNAGTLIVHATMTLGPINAATGRAAGEFPMTKTRVRVRAINGSSVTGTTNASGDARFVLAPGVYVVRLADLAQPDGAGGGPQLDCGVGDSPATVRVLPHVVVHAAVACGQP